MEPILVLKPALAAQFCSALEHYRVIFFQRALWIWQNDGGAAAAVWQENTVAECGGPCAATGCRERFLGCFGAGQFQRAVGGHAAAPL